MDVRSFFKGVKGAVRKGLSLDIHYEGNYSSWNDAERASQGYSKDSVLDAVLESARKVRDGNALFERDSVLFFEPEYPHFLFSSLLKVAQLEGNKLNVLDFGGSLGSLYYPARKYFPRLNEMSWSIVEQKHWVDVGKKEFEGEELKFYYTIEECLKNKKINVVVLSSVLQYLEDPYTWISKFKDSGVRYFILDRMPFTQSNDDRIAVQRVPDSIYKASYPIWFFNMERFLEAWKPLTVDSLNDPIDDYFLPDGSGYSKGLFLVGS